jgi:hypothetical protein
MYRVRDYAIGLLLATVLALPMMTMTTGCVEHRYMPSRSLSAASARSPPSNASSIVKTNPIIFTCSTRWRTRCLLSTPRHCVLWTTISQPARPTAIYAANAADVPTRSGQSCPPAFLRQRVSRCSRGARSKSHLRRANHLMAYDSRLYT